MVGPELEQGRRGVDGVARVEGRRWSTRSCSPRSRRAASCRKWRPSGSGSGEDRKVTLHRQPPWRPRPVGRRSVVARSFVHIPPSTRPGTWKRSRRALKPRGVAVVRHAGRSRGRESRAGVSPGDGRPGRGTSPPARGLVMDRQFDCGRERFGVLSARDAISVLRPADVSPNVASTRPSSRSDGSHR